MVVAYSMVAFLIAWISVGHQRAIGEIRVANRYIQKLQAVQLSEAALDQAIVQLASNNTADINAASLGEGLYSADIENSGSYYTVTGTGLINGITQSLEAILTPQSSSPYNWGLFGISSLNLFGSVTSDSYNSSEGTYAETQASNGDIGTNSTGANDLALTGSGTISGDLVVGNGGDPDSVIHTTGPFVVTGGEGASPTALAFPAAEVPEGLESEGSENLAGSSTLELAAGEYWYEDFVMRGSSTVTTTGATTVYVTGNLTLGGGAVGGGETAGNLKFMVVGDGAVTISGNPTMTCTIYAPESTLNLNGSAVIYGSVVADVVDVNGSVALHYDEALADESEGGASLPPTLDSWRNL